MRIMEFWLELGISRLRMDPMPFLIERKGVGVEPVQDFELLAEIREFLQWRCGDAVLLAEANEIRNANQPTISENVSKLVALGRS